MESLEALCMKCRVDNKPQKKAMQDITVYEKNNRYSAKGKCETCGGNMFKFMNQETAEKFAGDKGIQKAE